MTTSDPLDGRIREALGELVARTPVASEFDELEPRESSPQRRTALLVAAVALIVAVPLGVVLIGEDDTRVTTTPAEDPGRDVTGSATPCMARVTEFPDRATDVVVYLVPEATPEQREAVLTRLQDQESVRIVRSWEQAELYDEFLRHFAGSPEQRAGVTLESLPPRIELDVSAATPVDTVIALSEELPSVRAALNVEDAVEHLERSCQRSEDDLSGTEPDAVAAEWEVDPEAQLDPTVMTVPILVHETSCASGRSAEGRIEVVTTYRADEVELEVGVRPLGGDVNCPGNPTTPYTVELDEPLGDRSIVGERPISS